MVPGAVASAVFGRKGGKLADAKGNSYVMHIASGLLLASFILLSTFTGISPLYIASFLLLGNVGQSFITIAVSNSVSRTLPADQVGVGMGMLAMANFIGQDIAISIYGKVVDLGSAVIPNWNPLFSNVTGLIFSNMYFVLAGSQLVILGLYYVSFGRQKKRGIPAPQLIEKDVVPLSNI